MQVNLTASEIRKIKYLAETDPWFAAFLAASYNDVDSLIDANITDLASARRLLKLIVKIVMFLYRGQI